MIGGEYRSEVTQENLKKRRHIENFFSGFKRIMDTALGSRASDNLRKEAALLLLAYSFHR